MGLCGMVDVCWIDGWAVSILEPFLINFKLRPILAKYPSCIYVYMYICEFSIHRVAHATKNIHF